MQLSFRFFKESEKSADMTLNYGVPENPSDNPLIHFLLQTSGMHQYSPLLTWSGMHSKRK